MRIYLVLFSLFLSPSYLLAEPNDWSEHGATQYFYNKTAQLDWTNRMGDWTDASGASQGTDPFASLLVQDLDAEQTLSLNITNIVTGWVNGSIQNQGLFIIGNGGTVKVHTKEFADGSKHPSLEIQSSAGNFSLAAIDDTSITTSSQTTASGNSEILNISSGDFHYMIKFDLSSIPSGATIQVAELKLYTTDRQFGDTTFNVYRPTPSHYLANNPTTFGLAAGFTDDQNITSHSDVILADDFEAADWEDKWTYNNENALNGVISSDSAGGFAPFKGKALRGSIAAGSTTGLNMGFKFLEETGSEPEEIYFRYYLRLGPGFPTGVDGGKLPGIAGTYDTGGWGGRTSNGTNGWSARGLFKQPFNEGDPLFGQVAIGNYIYHTNQEGIFGDNDVWTNDYLGILQVNQWYCIEQYVKLNDPAGNDGVIRTWVGGKLAYERTGMNFRTTDALKIDRIWMNIYHGGTTPTPNEMHAYIDNVVVARSYIGPIPNAIGGPDGVKPSAPANLRPK